MNLFSKTGLALTALASLGVATMLPASAQSNISIFSTGVDSTGTVLPNGTLGDPHYKLLSSPAGDSTSLMVLTSAYGFPIVPAGWLGDSSTSAWIAPTNAPFVGAKPGGQYDYQTTFDLTNFDPATASITGQWSLDNYGTIEINGVSVASTFASDYSSYTPFSITSGFHAGLNTLDFLVTDDGSGVTGLRVDGITGSANPVPEASTTVSLGLLMTLGLGGMLVARRKSVKA